jgi:NAD(P)-dependent dehydrogenase (short-subunit alcohol dehydrogenase family)
VATYVSDSSADAAAELAAELESAYAVRVKTVQADMGSTGGAALVVATARNNFAHPKTGAFRIDVIVNNAGMAEHFALGSISAAAFERQYAVNVLGPLLLVQEALPHLPTDRSGRIVNVSSISAACGPAGQSIYAGTKAALEAMTRTWSRELAERATVNAITPGPVDTDMLPVNNEEWVQSIKPWMEHTPLAAVRDKVDPPEEHEIAKKIGGRRARPEEIAALIGMICSAESAWMTGSTVNANGGMVF